MSRLKFDFSKRVVEAPIEEIQKEKNPEERLKQLQQLECNKINDQIQLQLTIRNNEGQNIENLMNNVIKEGVQKHQEYLLNEITPIRNAQLLEQELP